MEKFPRGGLKQPKFALEEATPELAEQLIGLFHLHYRDVAHYKDIELAPDYDSYFAIQSRGWLRIYTARDEANAVIGYAMFVVGHNLHYRKSLEARQDLLFIHPEKRGFGGSFIDWCDDQLRAEGVQVVIHHVKNKPELNFSSALERRNYELVDLIYKKRLDLKGGI